MKNVQQLIFSPEKDLFTDLSHVVRKYSEARTFISAFYEKLKKT